MALSLDLRERILAAWDEGDSTRQEIAERFCVSLGMVKKLIQQRKRLGDIRPQHFRAGRKRKLTPEHEQRLAELVAQRPDMTIAQLRDALGVDCGLSTVDRALERLKLTYKKKPSRQASSSART